MVSVNDLIKYLKTYLSYNQSLEPDKIKEVINILENNILIPKSKIVYQVYNADTPEPIIEEKQIHELNAWELLHMEECELFRTEEEAKAYAANWFGNYGANQAEW